MVGPLPVWVELLIEQAQVKVNTSGYEYVLRLSTLGQTFG